jgi:predicted ATPase
VQDAAYSTLLRSQRQALHPRIGRTLEEHFPDVTTNRPEVLGHHFTEARLDEPAVEYCRKAGERALD